MARITKYLLLALIVAVAFNHAAKAQEEEAPAPEAEPAVEPAAEEPAAAVEEEPAPPPAEEPAAEPEVGAAPEVEEDNYSLGSIKKVGSWLSKFGWWNIWKGIGLKKAGDWWKWDKIFKEDWWKKKWFLLGSPLEEESKMMLVLSDPEARSSMGINGEEDATYFLAPPGFENELAKRGIAVNPSVVPVRKTQKKQYQQTQTQTEKQRTTHQYQEQRPLQYPQQQIRHIPNTQYPQSWLQRAFPSLDVYDREGGQGSEIDSVRMRPNTQSLSRSMVASLRQQIPDIIPLGTSVPNTPMYAYDRNGVMQLIQQQTPQTAQQQQQYQMMNEDTQNPAVLEEYQQARHGFQEILGRTKNPQTTKNTRINLRTEPEELLVPMPFPRSNSITTKEELERALNDEQTQKMLEQYARKNWKTIRKDAIILKFLPKTDMEARPSVKRQACAMMQEQMPVQTTVPRQMTIDHSTEQVNSAHARDMQQWAQNQQRAMKMHEQDQILRQMTLPQMQEPREELPQPIMQQRPMTPQEPRQMMTQNQQQNPISHQEPRQTVHDQTSAMHQQQPAIQQQTPIDHNQQHAMVQQEPRQWIQEQPITQQMPRQWIQQQPPQQPNMMVQQETVPQNEPRQWIQEQPHQQQNMMIPQETMPQNEPRQWVQEQQWTSVDPSVLDEMKPRQMTHQTLDQTQNTQTQQGLEGLSVTNGDKLENRDDQHPIVSEMGPQTEDNARFFKKVLLKKRPSTSAHYVTHNYNIYNSDAGHGSGGYGSGYGGSGGYGGGSSYGVGSSYGSSGYGGYGSSGHSSSYGAGHSSSYGGGHSSSYGSGHSGYGSGSGYSSSPSGSYGGHSYSSPSSGYGSGHSSSYGTGHGSQYGGGHSGGYRTAEMADNPMTHYQLQDPNPYRSRNPVHNHPISHVDEQNVLSHSTEPTQNQQAETNQEDHLNNNERTTSPTADETSRLASKPRLSHLRSYTDHRAKMYPSKRRVSLEHSELGNKKVHRARRSIQPSSRNLRRSRRQVSYGGGQGYSALESIAPSSLQKLREGYKENLKEITLQPNEDPAEALMRLNSQSIQEALYRASSEPIEVDGVPGQTVVHNEGSGHSPLVRQPAYQSQWTSQAPIYAADNVRSPMLYNNGNFYPDSAQNETVQTVSSVPFVRHDISNTRTYGVQHYGNQDQDYGNRGQQSVGMTMPQGRTAEATEHERSNIHQSTRYETQYQNQGFQPNTQVLNNPSYFYQQPNIPQVQYQYPLAPVENYNNQFSTPRTEVPSAPIVNYNQFSVPRSEVHQSAPITAYNQFSASRPEIPSAPIGNYNQFAVPTRSEVPQAPFGNYNQMTVPIRPEVQSAPIGNYNQFSSPQSELQSPLIGNYNQLSNQRLEIPSPPISGYNQFSALRPDNVAPIQYSDHFKNIADATLRDYIGNQLINPSANSINDLMEAIKKRLTTCCHKCKNQILKRITSEITAKSNQGISDDDNEEQEQEQEEEECLSCKASADFLSDLKNLQNDFLKNSKPKMTKNMDKEYKSENTFRYYRDPNAMNRQKATQAMWVKKTTTKTTEDNKENIRDRLNNDRHFQDMDYDYNVEGEYDRDQKPQTHRSNQERNLKRLTTSPQPRRSDRLENDRLQQNDNSHNIRTETSKIESRNPSHRVGSSTTNSIQQNSGDYEKRRIQGNTGYRRVNDSQGQRRLISRSGQNGNKSTNYDYGKQVKHENSNKNMGYTVNSVRVRKPKAKQEENNNDSPSKTIQKQLKELEAETKSENLENNEDNKSDILVEKKAKLIELLYFLYEMSKSTMGEQCQKTAVANDEVPSSTMSPPAIDVPSDSSAPEDHPSRHVKIPRKKEVKTLDYSTVRQLENNNKNASDGKKVRSIPRNYNYSGEDW